MSSGWVIIDGVLQYGGTISSGGQVLLATGTTSAPSLAFTAQTNTGLRFQSAGQLVIVAQGVDSMAFAAAFLSMLPATTLGWTASTISAGLDTSLVRDGAGILALKNSSASDLFRVYSFTAWAGVGFQGSALGFGTSSGADMWLVPGGTAAWQILASNGNIVDSGARAITAGGTITGLNLVAAATGQMIFTGRALFDSPADGIMQVSNNAGTGFTRLILGTNDATTNGLAIKLSGGGLAVRRGDDSSDADFSASHALFSNKITLYNGVSTAGWGIPAIQAAANITAQSSNATICSYANGAADGDFVVSAQMNVTVSTALTTTLTCTYTDVAGTARSMILPVQSVSGTFVAAGAITGAGASVWETPVMHIRAKASTTITLLTSAGTFTGVTYSGSGAIRQLA